MKICLVADYIPGYHKKWSGAEVFCYRLYEILKTRDHEAFILSTPFQKKSYQNNDFFQIHSLLKYDGKIGKIYRPILDPISILSCLWILMKLKPDVIHLHSKYLFIPIMIGAKILKIKTVYTFLDYYLFCHRNTFLKDNGTICSEQQGVRCAECSMHLVKNSLLKKLFAIIFKFIAIRRTLLNKYFTKKIDYFITLTTASRKRVISHRVPEDKISVIYYSYPRINSVNISLDKTKIFHTYSSSFFNKNTKYLLFVGSVSYHKGLEILIEAMPGVIEKYKNVKLLIGVGDAVDTHLKKVESLINKLNIHEYVIFLAKMDNADVINIISLSDIVIVPEQWPNEFGPVILVEALFCGKVVVASNIGGISEFILDGYNGFTFNRKDSKELTEKILTILNNDELYSRLSKNSRECVFHLPMFKEDVVNFYHQVIKS